MADRCCVCLLRLIILCPLLTGMIGAEVTHVFSTSDENVRLPCNNALSDCTSTTWTFSKYKDSQTYELIVEGKTKNETERHERLSLGSDCSLNIKKVTQEDYGLYTCQQYVSEQKQGTDASVYLHVLHVSTLSSQTEIRPGRSVTLSCQLHSYNEFPCDTLVSIEGIQLIWVNQAGVSVMTDSRYQIFYSTHCTSTLKTTLLNEDHNTEWRCQVTQRNQLKTSASFTVKYSAPVDSATLIPVSSSNSEKKSSRTTAAPTQQDNKVCADAGSLFRVIMIILEIAAFAAPTAILLQIICARRAGRKDPHHPEEMEMPTVLE